MSPEVSDLTVRIRAVDEVSPTLRRLGRQLWWMRYGGMVLSGLVVTVLVLLTFLAFVLGRLSA